MIESILSVLIALTIFEVTGKVLSSYLELRFLRKKAKVIQDDLNNQLHLVRQQLQKEKEEYIRLIKEEYGNSNGPKNGGLN